MPVSLRKPLKEGFLVSNQFFVNPKENFERDFSLFFKYNNQLMLHNYQNNSQYP